MAPPRPRSRQGGSGPAISPQTMTLVAYFFLTLAVVSLSLLLMPSRFAGKLPKPLRFYRSKMLSWWRRARELSAEGPFYKLIVWAGKKVGRGYLASAPRAPTVKAKPHGCGEVEVLLGSRFPWNPFHEENYLLSWRPAPAEDGAEERWRYKEFNSEFDFEKTGGKLRTIIDGLPENTTFHVRACAMNKRGASSQSKEAVVETMCKPSPQGGSTGPCGPAAGGRKVRYTWSQNASEAHLKLPLASNVRARDIRVKCTGLRLEIRLAEEAMADAAGKSGSPDLLVGNLYKKVKPDEIFWTIEEEDAKFGRHLVVQLVKTEPAQKWECLIEGDGHSRIDIQHVRFFDGNDFAGLGGDLSGLLNR